MGMTADLPKVRLTLTKSDAGRLAETLTQSREILTNVKDDVGSAQRDFLDQVIASLKAAIVAAEPKPEEKKAEVAVVASATVSTAPLAT